MEPVLLPERTLTRHPLQVTLANPLGIDMLELIRFLSQRWHVVLGEGQYQNGIPLGTLLLEEL